MKKILNLAVLIIFTSTFYWGCKKDQSAPVDKNLNDEQQLIANAKTYFENNVQNTSEGKALFELSKGDKKQFNIVKSLIKNAVWDKAYLQRISIGDIVVVPINFRDNLYIQPIGTDTPTRLSVNNLSKLIVYTDPLKQMHAEVVTAWPDENFIHDPEKEFSGITLIQDWYGNLLNQYQYKKGEIINISLTQKSSDRIAATDAMMAEPINTCSPTYAIVDGGIGGPNMIYIGCDGGGGSGSSSSGSSSSSAGTGGSGGSSPSGSDYGSVAKGGGTSRSTNNNFVFLAPKSPIDIIQELKCFTANNSSKYYITLNVEEPGPGTGESSAPGVEAGHVYLTFEQDNADGSKIVRNHGFYPINTLAAIVPKNTPSTFGDDSYTTASATLKITTNSQDFMTVVQNIKNQASRAYNLYSYNCTTSAISALVSIGINNLDTYRPGSPVTGGDPGLLGNTIRNLNLDGFSSSIGGRQVIRNLSNENSILPAAKQGTCN